MLLVVGEKRLKEREGEKERGGGREREGERERERGRGEGEGGDLCNIKMYEWGCRGKLIFEFYLSPVVLWVMLCLLSPCQ